MPGQRYQDPKIQERTDVERPFYYIRPYVPVITATGLVRKKKRIQLGFMDEMSMREAKSAKQQAMATINDNKFLIQSQIPFKTVLDRYVEVRLPQIPSTRDSYQNKIDKHIRPAFEWTQDGRKKRPLRMCDIDKPMVEAWLNAKAADGYSHNTLLDLRKVLSAIFAQAAEWKYWQGENPCWKLKNKIGGKTEVFPAKLPQADGLLRFLGAMEDTCIVPAEGARLIVLTALAIGTRVCEVLALQPGDVDGGAETITIQRDWARGRVGPTKTPESKRTREAPGITAELLDYAKGRGIPADGFIFGRPDRDGLPPDDRDLQQHVFRPAAERAGIYAPGFGLRRFRGINISWRQQVGAHPLEAQKAAGHTKLSTTWIYTQNEKERDREHVMKILERMQGKPEGGVQ
jgi:integrase